MGAANWARCPMCMVKQRKDYAEAQVRVREVYGKVPVEKYLEARVTAEKLPNGEDAYPEQYTLAEDYEIGIDMDGEFYVIYRGECRKCHYGKSFEHRETLAAESKPLPDKYA